MLLRRHGSDGTVHCAEASPLPGHSSDRLEEVVQAAEHLSSAAFEECLQDPAAARDLPAALRYAVESISELTKGARGFLPVRSNGLAPWSAGTTPARIRSLLESGYDVVKLKVNDEALASLPAMLGSMPGGSWKLRLDGNRSLSVPVLAAFFGDLMSRDLLSRIDYLEEPLASGWAHPLLRESPVALACDESAPTPTAALELLEQRHAPQVFVLKPTVMGGLASLSNLQAQLQRAGRRTVFTTSLETEPGRRALIAYLSRTGGQEAHGLGTGFLLERNFLPDLPRYEAVPPVNAEEQKLWQALDWRGCP